MWELHRLHMVDSADRGTSSSVPHLKQRRRRTSIEGLAAIGAGWRASCRRKWRRHFLQMLEYALSGSGCTWPQLGQTTAIVFGLEAAITGIPLQA